MGVQDVVGKAKAAGADALDAVRGSGEQEKMLRNARQKFLGDLLSSLSMEGRS
ncbi:MAG TPA: hypothetical protein VFW14_09780 [Gaiellales bacterium]|jgi:hypothetical protein|nr:hypothetical protein [Gaiellales bacterium]